MELHSEIAASGHQAHKQGDGQPQIHNSVMYESPTNQFNPLTVNTMRCIIFAVERIPLLAVMAVPAHLGVVRRHLLPDMQALYISAELDDDARGFVARCHGHARAEVAVVDVEVGAADAAGLDYKGTRGSIVVLGDGRGLAGVRGGWVGMYVCCTSSLLMLID